MNERIRELLAQATYDVLGVKQVDQNQFAELIVRDCINIIEGYCETTPEIYGLPLEIVDHFDMELDDAD